MEQVWKCSKCSFTHVRQSRVRSHERVCISTTTTTQAVTPDMSKMKKACYTCGYYTGDHKKKKCFTSQCPMFVRPRPKKRVGSFNKNDEPSVGMGDGTTLGIGGVKT